MGKVEMEFDSNFHMEVAKTMEYRRLGKTDVMVSKLSLGGASFGNIYGNITQETVNEMVLKAVQSGINFIDTSPWYGQGMGEERLGIALKNVPRDKYYIATKVGRYEQNPLNEMFDFSASKVEQSFKKSLERLQLPYVDLIQVHDIEFSQSIDQIVKHTLPTLMKLKKAGLARYIGVTGYNLGVLKKVVQLSEPGTIDTILSYGRCNIMNQDLLEDVEFYQQRGIGIINASPLALGLLNNECNYPDWHVALSLTKEFSKKAAKLCIEKEANLAMIAMQYSLNQDEWVSTALSSMINDEQLGANLKSATSSCEDPELMAELKAIFDDLPVTQWENLETGKYWAKMVQNGWKQNVDW